MATNFPGGVDSFKRPNTRDSGVYLANIEEYDVVGDMADAVEAIESELVANPVNTGWIFYVDGTYLAQATSPFSISAETRTKLENDGTSSLTNTSYSGGLVSGIYDTANDKMVPELGKSYDVRLTYKCQTASGASGNFITTELDIGAGGIGTGPVIWAQTQPLLKGANVENSMSYAVTIFALAPFPTTGGTFYVESNVACDIWDIRLLITAL